MEVTIIGPMPRGAGFRVHRTGCADLRRGELRSKDQRWTLDATHKSDVIEDIYGDMMSDDDSPNDCYAADVEFAPCCSDLK